jgi:DNA-binding XRE family transcriptional regulator
MKEQIMTSYVNVTYRIPKEHLDEARKNMASYGAEEVIESIPWEQAFPDYNASVALRGARHKESLTQKELAKLMGISQHHISEMENGKRPIGKDMAKKLSQILHVSYRVFL